MNILLHIDEKGIDYTVKEENMTEDEIVMKHVRKLLLIVLIFMMLLKTFFFMRVFKSMAHLVSMMKQVFNDL